MPSQQSCSSSAARAAAAAPAYRTLRAAAACALVALVLGAHVAAAANTVYMLPLRQHKATLGANGAKAFTKTIHTTSVGKDGVSTQVAAHITMLAGCASSGFSTPVTIGSQTFNVLVDSGSSTLAVAGTSCSGNSCSGSQTLSPLYTPSASAQDMNNDISVTYGSGSWEGRAYRDSVNVAGVGAVRMVVAAIETATDFFRTSKCAATYDQANTYQGILGMAYGSLAPSGSDAYWDTLMDSNQGVADVFAHQMCSSGSGRLWIGGYDASFFTGSLTYTPIIDESWYVVGMQGMSLGGTAVNVAASAYGTTIVDSGTTAIIIPAAVYTALTQQIEANSYFSTNFGADFFTSGGYCVVPANGATVDDLNANLPKLAINMNGVTLTLNAVSSYLLDQTDASGTHYYCPGLSRNDGNNAQTILGYAALNQHTVVYDRANSRVGFAPTNYCGTASPPVTGYAWYASAWGTCSSADGTSAGCTHSRTVACKDSNGNAATDSQCTAADKPTLSETGCESWGSDAGVCQGSEPSALQSWWDSHPTARILIIVFAVALGLCIIISCCKCFCRCCCGDSKEPVTPRTRYGQQFTPLYVGQQGGVSHAQGRRDPYPAHSGYRSAPPPAGAPAGSAAPQATAAGATGATAGGADHVAVVVAN